MNPSADSAAEPLLARAQAALSDGRAAEALSLSRQALAARPGWPPALLLQANAGLGCNDLDAAIDALQKLCQMSPAPPLRNALATALNNRGSRARRAGQEERALQDFEAALAQQPQHALAGFNRALSLLALGRRAEAESALDAHLRSHPDDLEAQLERLLLLPDTASRAEALTRPLAHPQASALPAELRLRAALASREPERALPCLMEIPEVHRVSWAWSVGERLRLDNLTDAARRAYGSAATLPQCPLQIRLAAALSAPLVADNPRQIAETRERQRHTLRELLDAQQAGPAPATSLDGLAWSHFMLAYMGEDDTDLMRDLGALVRGNARAIAPRFTDTPPCLHPGRVVLVGSVFRDCTGGAYFGGWLDWLRDAGFEVVLYQLGPRRDAETERMAAAVSRFHFIDEHAPLDALAEQLRAEGAGLILYPELGMDSRLYPLAALRLARRQAMAWGHPVTSGLDSLDAYLGCAEMEPADAAAHYIEPLRLLPGLAVDYRRPALPPPASRAELGLPEQGPLLLAPQSLFKLHPDNDALYAELLRRLPRASLLLFEDRPAWRDALSRRLRRAGVEAQRLHWLATGSRARYLQINAACDLMLDSRHFSGGNASLDALQAGLPVLTTPGRFMRGRQTAAMLARMGLRERLCVDDPARLADRAVELIQSGEAEDLRRSIPQRLPALFEAEAARRAFVEHIQQLTSNIA